MKKQQRLRGETRTHARVSGGKGEERRGKGEPKSVWLVAPVAGASLLISGDSSNLRYSCTLLYIYKVASSSIDAIQPLATLWLTFAARMITLISPQLLTQRRAAPISNVRLMGTAYGWARPIHVVASETARQSSAHAYAARVGSSFRPCRRHRRGHGHQARA